MSSESKLKFGFTGPKFLRTCKSPIFSSASTASPDGAEIKGIMSGVNCLACAQVCGDFCDDIQTGQDCLELWHGLLGSGLIYLQRFSPESTV